MSVIKSKAYIEEQARLTLHHVCGFELDSWKCADKPDLQSITENCGIEVIQDVYQNEQELFRFGETIWKKPYSEIDDRKIKRFEKSGGSIFTQDGIVCSASLGRTDNNPEHLIDTIIKKIKKINEGGYQYFERYELYVFVETVILDEYSASYVHQVIDKISKCQGDCSIKYDTLYLDQHYTMCVCNMRENTFSRIEITPEMREHIHQELKEKWPD